MKTHCRACCIPASLHLSCTVAAAGAAAAHLHGRDPVQIAAVVRQQGARPGWKVRAAAPGARPLHRWQGDGCRCAKCITCVCSTPPLLPTTTASSLLPLTHLTFWPLPSAGLRRRMSTWRGRWSRTKARWQRKRRSVSFNDCHFRKTQPTNVADKGNVPLLLLLLI